MKTTPFEYATLEELKHQLEGVEMAFERADHWLWDLDLCQNKLFVIGGGAARLGIHKQSDVHLSYLDYLIDRVHPDDRELIIEQIQQILDGKSLHFEMKHRFVEMTGDVIWVFSRLTSKYDQNGNLIRLIGSHSDMNEHYYAVEKLEQLAYIDPITGMQNRNSLMSHLGDRFWNFDYNHVSGSILLIGLDHFKYANSTYGHYVGDRILKSVGEMIQTVPVEAEAFYSRYESDHFCIVVNATDESVVMAYAGEILKIIAKGIRIENEEYNLTASIGISSFPLHGTSYDELLKNAESALGAAKSSGKNKYMYYEYNMNVQLIERWTISQELLAAVDHNELRLVYQPIVNLPNDKIIGFEALVRWQNNKLGLVPPNRFIPLAEEIGVISAIDYWVIKESLHMIGRINHAYKSDYYVAVNISSTHLTERNFVQNVALAIANSGVSAKWLRIEITEHALIASIEESQQVLNRLKAMGIQIYLDDFGTGYSSFNYLKNLPVDVVKLDMSFISDLLKDPQSERLIDGIIQLAHILNLKICAEGIEEPEQAQILKRLCCDLGQGYLYSRPVEEDILCSLIENNSSKS